MLRVGLTGGIASGKSTVSGILRRLGAPVVDADQLVHDLYEPGTAASIAIAQAFGSGVLRPDGGVDRAELGRIVFADQTARRQLESIIHPAVRERMWQEAERYAQLGHKVCVLDVPLLIEGGLHLQMDRVWVVYVDHETQRQRLMQRNGFSLEEAERRIAAQMPLAEKLAFADLVLDNGGDLATLEEQVRLQWERLLAEAST